MGTHQGGNGGNVPPDGDRTPDEPVELPELPPEWGDVTIPDDLSELGDEVDQIRQELAEQRRSGFPGGSRQPVGGAQREPSVGMPLLIMSVAVLITLVSLFAMAWSGSGGAERSTSRGTAPPSLPPNMMLADETGRQVLLTNHMPAVILLVEACDNCDELIAETTARVPAGVSVIAIGGWSAPSQPAALPDDVQPPIRLADPDGRLRAELDLGAPTNAADVVLVDRDRGIVSIVSGITMTGQFHNDLVELTR